MKMVPVLLMLPLFSCSRDKARELGRESRQLGEAVHQNVGRHISESVEGYVEGYVERAVEAQGPAATDGDEAAPSWDPSKEALPPGLTPAE